MTYEKLFDAINTCISEDIATLDFFDSESNFYNGMKALANGDSDSLLDAIITFLDAYYDIDSELCDAYKEEIRAIVASCAKDVLSNLHVACV